ncbi:hypothetical protein [Alkalihalobacterium elongatum]|uniref:hypothetical protein n=1 Tax=Alkalihalobacterium elongatum TaxID=2675466 RepID=UPI001C1FE33C|nr:hypothetical protein [Alkalihalobacterium elongatum]
MKRLNSALLLLLSVLLLFGCQSDNSGSDALQPPFDAVPNDFEFRVFELPDGWDVVILSMHFPTESIASGMVELAEQPNEIRMVFGEKSSKNEYNVTEINKNEQERNANFRTLYAHSEDIRYGEMSIMKIQEPVEDEKNALENTVFHSFDEMPHIDVDGKKVYYYIWDGRETPMFYLWFSDDKKYRYSFGHYENETLTVDETIPFLEKLISENK